MEEKKKKEMVRKVKVLFLSLERMAAARTVQLNALKACHMCTMDTYLCQDTKRHHQCSARHRFWKIEIKRSNKKNSYDSYEYDVRDLSHKCKYQQVLSTTCGSL